MEVLKSNTSANDEKGLVLILRCFQNLFLPWQF